MTRGLLHPWGQPASAMIEPLSAPRSTPTLLHNPHHHTTLQGAVIAYCQMPVEMAAFTLSSLTQVDGLEARAQPACSWVLHRVVRC